MKITLDTKCSLCGREEETIVMIVNFLNLCNVTKFIWKSFTNWLHNLTSFRINISLAHILFGFIEKRNDALKGRESDRSWGKAWYSRMKQLHGQLFHGAVTFSLRARTACRKQLLLPFPYGAVQ